MKVIAIHGKSGSGKSLTAQILKLLFSKEYDNVVIKSFASSLKQKAELLGWDNKKDDKGRQLLQDLGKVLKNYHGSDYFADILFRSIDHKNIDILIIDDLRFMSELLSICCKTDVERSVLVHIDRPFENQLTQNQNQDISETDLDEFDEWDVTIYNNSNSMLNLMNDIHTKYYPRIKFYLDEITK